MTGKPSCIIKPSASWLSLVAGKIKALIKSRQDVRSFNPGSEGAPEDRSEIPRKSQPGSMLLLTTEAVAQQRVKKDLQYVNKSLTLPGFIPVPEFSDTVTELSTDEQLLFRQSIISMGKGEEKRVNKLNKNKGIRE